MACVSKECRRIADSDESYRGQYIRDFGRLQQDHSGWAYWTFRRQSWFHASAEQGSEPPKRWKFKAEGIEVEYDDQESSWKRAYIRMHNWEFPQEIYTRLPALPYNKRHVDIVSKHRLKACHSPVTTLRYLRGLYLKSPICLAELFVRAMCHGVRPDVEFLLTLRGWVLCRSSVESIRFGHLTRGRCLTCSDFVATEIPLRNQRRQTKLQGAAIGARPGMAQVPVESETRLIW